MRNSKYLHVTYSTTYLLTVMIKNLAKCITALTFLISLSGCASSYYSYKVAATSDSERLPRKSFALIQNSVTIRACLKREEGKEPICHTGTLAASSSGIFVERSEVDTGVSYVLTAGHSCSSETFKERFNSPGITAEVLNHKLEVVTYYGKKYRASIVKTQKKHDMCLLYAHDIDRHPQPVQLSSTPPKRGQEVYNLAAPLGIFYPKMVMTMHGFFSGHDKNGYAHFTIPTKPGSSGSAILNSSGKIVGMIFAGYRGIENIAISSSHALLSSFLKNTITVGEMALFASKKMEQQLIIDRLK